MKVPKSIQPLVRAALAAGWTVDQTKSHHLRFRAPDGTVVIHGSTPSCTRGLLNLRAGLRRAGLDV